MAAQKLVSIITCPWLYPGDGVQVPHGLRSAGRAVPPRSVMPEKATSIIVTTVDDTYVHFFNAGSSGDEVRFKAEAGLSLEWGPPSEPPFLWQGAFGDGTGTVQYVGTGDGLQGGPITGSGTISMRPLTPNPAGTYGSASAIPVVTVNNKGQVTSVTTQPISGSGLTGVNVTAPITKGGTAATPTIGITLGTTASSACAGNDARLSDQRVPTDGSVTDVKVAAANKDGLAAVPSMRTLGTGAQQACAGNDNRLLGTRTIIDSYYVNPLSSADPSNTFMLRGTLPPEVASIGYVIPFQNTFPPMAWVEPVARQVTIHVRIDGFVYSIATSEVYLDSEEVELKLEAYNDITAVWDEFAKKRIYISPEISIYTRHTLKHQIPDLFRVFRMPAGAVKWTNFRLTLRQVPRPGYTGLTMSGGVKYQIDDVHIHWSWR